MRSSCHDSAVKSARADLEREIELLSSPSRLVAILDKRIAALEAAKGAAKTQATKDVRAYTWRQWERSWFRDTEVDEAIRARAREIFDRPERRALDAAKAQRAIAASIDGGDDDARDALVRAYREIGMSLAMNEDLGVMPQVWQRIVHFVQRFAPSLRDRASAEASNLEGDGPAAGRDPRASAAWSRRAAHEVTPKRLFRGPWYDDDADVPKLPADGETWDLSELRSPKADGGHASVGIANGDDVVKMKFHTDPETDLWCEPIYARLLWAMGWETDPQALVRDVRIAPRVFAAAFATIATIGLHVGPELDETIAGRPPRGLSFAFNGMEKAPGAGWVKVRWRDGREMEGREAIDALRSAIDDRRLLDAMDHVVVRRAYVELPRPGKWSSIGPWSFDADEHIDEREVRALGIVAVGWLGFDDIKFNNLRLDVDDKKAGKHVRVIADVGITQRTRDLAWEVGVRATDRFPHGDGNAYTIRAFDRMTLADATWGVARIAELSEAQILACAAAGSFDDAALGLFVEKLVARRDELVSAFGLAEQVGLLRPNGPDRSPPPRRFEA